MNEQQLLEKILNFYSGCLIDYNVKLILAIEEENYEDAAKFRDKINSLIDRTTKVLEAQFPKILVQSKLIEQNNMVFKELFLAKQ